jgi:peptidoglycan L-alanyl-D-glutamate endopeptidase CwlK
MIKDLDSQTADLVTKFISELVHEGLEYVITCTHRSENEQAALYMQGRAPLSEVNEVRIVLKMAPITSKENRIVTYARPGESLHNLRRAVDIYPLDGGKLVLRDKHPHLVMLNREWSVEADF